MNKPKHIRCAECRYAMIDKRTSVYIQKKQVLKWVGIQCACPDSEYHLALLNVTPNGNRLDFVSWGGCVHGERRCSA